MRCRLVSNNSGDLGVAGTIQGQQFLVIFEDPNYMGPPVAHNFVGSILGIKVRDNFFSGYGSNPTRLHGR